MIFPCLSSFTRSNSRQPFSIVKTLLGNIAESAIREISSGEKFQAYWQAIVKNLFRKKNKNEEATSTDEEDDFID